MRKQADPLDTRSGVRLHWATDLSRCAGTAPAKTGSRSNRSLGGPPVPPKIILLVDDKPQVRSAIADMLRDEGHEVAEVANGRLALSLIKQRPFDLIISDIRMPELGARGLYEQLGYFQRGLLDRFIVITGWDDGDTEFFETKTAVPVLRKPLLLEKLLDAIHRVLQRGSETESPAPHP